MFGYKPPASLPPAAPCPDSAAAEPGADAEPGAVLRILNIWRMAISCRACRLDLKLFTGMLSRIVWSSRAMFKRFIKCWLISSSGICLYLISLYPTSACSK